MISRGFLIEPFCMKCQRRPDYYSTTVEMSTQDILVFARCHGKKEVKRIHKSTIEDFQGDSYMVALFKKDMEPEIPDRVPTKNGLRVLRIKDSRKRTWLKKCHPPRK